MLQPVLERGLCVGKQCRIISYIIYNYKKDQKKHNKGDPERAACSKKEGDGCNCDQNYFLDSNETERPSPNNKPLF